MIDKELENYYEKLQSKINELEREFERYSDTILLLYSFWRFFCRTYKIPMEIEPKIAIHVDSSKTKELTPDIVVYSKRSDQEKIPILVIDYKWSLKRKLEYIMKELNEMYDKYSKICKEVVALISSEDERRIKPILDKLPDGLMIWSAEIDKEKRKIKIKFIKGNPSENKFIKILRKNNNIVPLDITGTTRYAFIREKPPSAYAAYRIWIVIYILAQNLELYDTSEHEFSFEEIDRELTNFFPPWISEEKYIRQINKSTFNEALKILEYAGFVEVDWTDRKIKVFLDKGKRVSDLKGYIIQKAAEKVIPKPKKKRKQPKGQATLSDFFKA